MNMTIHIVKYKYYVCTLAVAENHKITWLTLENMAIDIKTDNFAHFSMYKYCTNK